jgi:L-2-hydroxycarboxylate dehydrogenase (NAD+)
MTQEILIPVSTLAQFMRDVFTKLGVPADDAAISAEVLITADLRGIESHGISRLKYYYDRILAGVQQVETRFEVIKETETTALVDGHHGMGHVIASRAMQLAIEKAKQFGLGAVSVRNSTHFGIAGFYSLMAAKEGLIGLEPIPLPLLPPLTCRFPFALMGRLPSPSVESLR